MAHECPHFFSLGGYPKVLNLDQYLCDPLLQGDTIASPVRESEIELQPEFLQVIKNFSSSAYGEIYALGIAMYNDHKLVGVGLNNFTYLCNNDERYKNIIKNYVCVSHPHNIYLQWLVESGVLGLIFFILYLSSLFYFILIKKINEYSLLSFATLLVLFWPIMSTGSLLKNWNGVSTFYIIGICITLTKLKKKIN